MSRYYELPEGRKYPSVTTILSVIGKPALVNWAAKVEREMVIDVSSKLYEHSYKGRQLSTATWKLSLNDWLGKTKAADKALAKAGEIGSQAHALIEWTLKADICEKAGPSPEIGPEAQWAFAAWQRWRDRVKLKALAIESVVWSDKYKYAGTLDLLCEITPEGSKERVLAVADWKSGKSIYPEARLQNAAYRQAIEEMGHGRPELGLIVRLPKIKTDPEFEVLQINGEQDSLFEMFIHAHELWKWQQKMSAWKETEEIKNVA